VAWRELPVCVGAGANVHGRFSRWAKSGVPDLIFQNLAADAEKEHAIIDTAFYVATNSAPA
jgi:hypothetical protein